MRSNLVAFISIATRLPRSLIATSKAARNDMRVKEKACLFSQAGFSFISKCITDTVCTMVLVCILPIRQGLTNDVVLSSQGQALGREGQLQLELHQDKILVGGAAVTCIDGTIKL